MRAWGFMGVLLLDVPASALPALDIRRVGKAGRRVSIDVRRLAAVPTLRRETCGNASFCPPYGSFCGLHARMLWSGSVRNFGATSLAKSSSEASAFSTPYHGG